MKTPPVGSLVEIRLQLVTEAERLGQVVGRVKHQAVTEAVVALVVVERDRLDLGVVAHLARDPSDLGFP